ncbi:sugar-binding protein [Streptomyces lunaelactis]|uniref:Sugar-binding protein n=1 Tax=Streptomyces lunaelactis TaxID=1535768 RepID=A0A2R4T1P7_9ACTN|nr:glutamate ABC transporter substrate-binding protein [Streptomyces lunaelactis]AVZ73065.1 sugar-binding protein [Streptomyces lunaelactis]NUK03707.1 glutamate ABC transporter substrate-binding protein [Streptomyces lunaelactis]NUK10642.1 glutamate ABC transporter substrate-binding protein [Streptomyces lunaelactis]NUK18076.1 glutamate ABC transporter substrate-binding protein [Streptomyces lunaelactis]NUK26033.1 glutamate ABC transporter substrate-binding protein [Streptomyces lunaelactis]
MTGTRTGFRGWGGVAGMAAACALTAAVTLLPLSHGGADGLGAGSSGQSAASSVPVKADDCKDPEASLPSSAAGGPNIDAIRERGKLIVGVDQNSYRWGYRNPASGGLEGFDIDLAHAIAQDILGKPDAVIFRAIPTNQRIPALNNGTVDIVVRTMTINCARIKQVAFSTAYFQTGQQVLAPKGSSITGYDKSLAGKKVCSAEGSTAYDALEKNSFGATFKDKHDGQPGDEDQFTVPNQLDCLVRLQLGLVDAVVTDAALAAGQAAQDPAVELKGGKPFTTEYYGVATKLGKDDVVRRVNKVLDTYRQGAWTQAYDKWLVADLPGITGPPAPKFRTG